jgi:hypothetical protein
VYSQWIESELPVTAGFARICRFFRGNEKQNPPEIAPLRRHAEIERGGDILTEFWQDAKKRPFSCCIDEKNSDRIYEF